MLRKFSQDLAKNIWKLRWIAILAESNLQKSSGMGVHFPESWKMVSLSEGVARLLQNYETREESDGIR